MRRGFGEIALTWGLVALVLLNACATVPQAGTGGSGRFEPEGTYQGSEEPSEEAREAELESALTALWGVASEVREVGAELEFTFWTERGAFTLLSLKRRQGGAPGKAAARESFASEVRDLLSACAEGAPGAVHLILRRDETRWRADFKKDEAVAFPPEAKTWPVQRVGTRSEELQGLVGAGREVASRIWVPTGARVRWQVEIALDDERVTGLETRPPRSLPGGTSVRADPGLMGPWVNVLVPFTQGLGPRKVRMDWEGEHLPGTQQSRWRIVAAEVVRPPPPEPRNAEVALEYRAMHEQILRQWREETRESFQAMAVIGLEQLALYVVGGWLARGTGVALEAAAPTISRVLARGGMEAVGWFRSLLARAPTAERQAFARLVARMEAEGFEALTAAERSELRALLLRFERLTTTPLKELDGAKDLLRDEAKTLFYGKRHPKLDALLRDIHGVRYDIHHCIPLEYAHLFPLRDVNAELNLVAAAKPIHSSVGSVWTRLRKAPRPPTAEEVLRVEEIVRARFGRWFNKIYDESAGALEELSQAKRLATNEVDALVAGMR
ncbi:hypothetical protein [Hyalangium versicolor]|uniref:hypothetical protein n=1 Tax=Hyalangium versicolor TaxID=2861190 RepID=UPI001CC91A2B|nr:hypothetical protein [Hyalangium versicolor]